MFEALKEQAAQHSMDTENVSSCELAEPTTEECAFVTCTGTCPRARTSPVPVNVSVSSTSVSWYRACSLPARQ